jgi:hypothetical protein
MRHQVGDVLVGGMARGLDDLQTAFHNSAAIFGKGRRKMPPKGLPLKSRTRNFTR